MSDVNLVDLAMVKEWSQRFTQVSLVVLGGGPPCQGVSGLNASRKGALKDERSCLFTHVQRIRDLVKQCFVWAQVRLLMESVASMDQCDEDVMSASVAEQPWHNAAGVSLAHRPRLYWLDWELRPQSEVVFGQTPAGRKSVTFDVSIDPKDFLQAGWQQTTPGKFPTFTTSRPRAEPGYKPAGLKQCTLQEAALWKEDLHRFPPYQYQRKFLVVNKRGPHEFPT